MAVQDLTPQLRTRLGRVERAVAVFVTLATSLLLAGFAYYLYRTGENKGWYVLKLRYYTSLDSASGLKVGNKVRLMGFDVGEITRITANSPEDARWIGNVYVEFLVHEPYNGYIKFDSKVKAGSTGFPPQRILELVTGDVEKQTDVVYKLEKGKATQIKNDKGVKTNANQPPIYLALTNRDAQIYGLIAEESPDPMEQLSSIAKQAQEALPGIFDLTNQVAKVLLNVAQMTEQANRLLSNAQPTITNLAAITGNLKDPNGSLGQWLIPTNLSLQLTQTLAAANLTLARANTTLSNTDNNLTAVATGLDETLVNLANLTSNLNAQVAANTNLVSNISGMIVHSDEMIQGLKTHWLLRSAFKNKTNEPPKKIRPTRPLKAGKQQ